jgi:hypothetical protein
MRLDVGPEEEQFAEWLLDVGHGRLNDPADGTMALPFDIITRDSENLIDSIFPRINGPTPPPSYFLECSILAARNGDVDGLNDNVLDRMVGERHTFISADKITTEAGADDPQVHDAIPAVIRTAVSVLKDM